MKGSQNDVFSKYLSDNNATLTGIGIFATVAALFLNLDQSVFGDSLRSLQLLLLLFLILGLSFLAFNSLFWLKDNSDSYFSGLIIFTLWLTIWQIWEFILGNFRNELNKYLLFIVFGVMLVIGSFLASIKEKIELSSEKYVGYLSKALFRGFSAFLFLYFFSVILRYYLDFASSKELSISRLQFPFSDTILWTMPIWVAVNNFCINFFFTKSKLDLMLGMILFIVLLVSLLVILLTSVSGIYIK